MEYPQSHQPEKVWSMLRRRINLLYILTLHTMCRKSVVTAETFLKAVMSCARYPNICSKTSGGKVLKDSCECESGYVSSHMVDQFDHKTRVQGHLKEILQCYVLKTRAVGQSSRKINIFVFQRKRRLNIKELNIVIGLFPPLVIDFCHISLPGLAVVAHF